MKKKVISYLLAALMLTAAVTACGNSGGAQSGQSGAQQQQGGSEENGENEEEEDPGPEPGTQEDVIPGAEGPSAQAGNEEPEAAEPVPDTGVAVETEEEGPQMVAGGEGEAAENAPGTSPGTAESEAEEEDSVWETPGAGISFQVPESFKQLKGFIFQGGGGETVPGSGVTYYVISYMGVAAEDYEEFLEKSEESEPSEEEVSRMQNAYRELFTVYSIDGNRTQKDLEDYLKEAGIMDPALEKIAEVGEYTFFFSPEATEENIDQLGDFAQEFKALAGDMDSYKAAITCSEPVPSDAVQ